MAAPLTDLHQLQALRASSQEHHLSQQLRNIHKHSIDLIISPLNPQFTSFRTVTGQFNTQQFTVWVYIVFTRALINPKQHKIAGNYGQQAHQDLQSLMVVSHTPEGNLPRCKREGDAHRLSQEILVTLAILLMSYGSSTTIAL